MPGIFDAHELNPQGLARLAAVAHGFDALLGALAQLGVTGREGALVVTKLQEACFWARHAIATRPENQADFAPHQIVVEQDGTYCLKCDDRRAPSCAGSAP